MVLRAFESRNYRLYFSGQSVSLIGTWMQRTAVYWLVYEQTQSSAMLGLAVFATQFPSFLFSIFGGVLSDRYSRYTILLTTQIASLVQALILTWIVFAVQYSVWHIIGLSVVLGLINAFDVPARQALVYDMVDKKEYVPNAIALNSSMVHAARLAGPAVSGITLEYLGAATCFLANAFSFLAVIISLLLMKMPPSRQHAHTSSAFGDLRQGFRYLVDTPSLSNVMLMLACVSFFSLPYITLLPVFADDIFQGQASTFGYLNSFIGLGALTGALFLASLRAGANLKKVLLISTVLFGTGLILFSQVENLPIAFAILSVTGFGMMSQTTISNTLIQTTVAPVMRGRVISYYAMAFFGMQPLGGLLVGALSHYIGAQRTLLAEGIYTLLIALIFLPFLRRKEFTVKQKLKLDQLEERTIETT